MGGVAGERFGWYNQRHMLERLDQEAARARRQGGDFTVVLAEVQGARREQLSPAETDHLATWTAARVTQAKRRSDVAGQYGPHGFMLLLPGATAVARSAPAGGCKGAGGAAGPGGNAAAAGAGVFRPCSVLTGRIVRQDVAAAGGGAAGSRLSGIGERVEV